MIRRALQNLESWSSTSPPKHSIAEPNGAEVSVQRIDFVALGFPEYEHRFALIIDNLFSEEDCQKILGVTGASFGPEKWEVAAVHGGPGSEGTVVADYRNSSRIMVDDHDMADWIFERIQPHLKDIDLLEHSSMHDRCAKGPTSSDPLERRAKLLRCNERLRFLRYGPGQFFQRHCDGLYYTPDRKQASYYTLQLYLNGDSETLKGGATRFYSRKDSWERPKLMGPCIDVPPRTGRVLVFEQQGLLHSGEPVIEGVKVAMRTDFMYDLVEVEGKE